MERGSKLVELKLSGKIQLRGRPSPLSGRPEDAP